MKKILFGLFIIIGYGVFGQTEPINPEAVYTDNIYVDSIQVQSDDSITVKSTISMRGNQIKYLADPTANQDAATKAYVDGSSTSPGGADTNVQYNNAGAFGGDANFTTDGSGSVDITGDLDVDNLNLNGDTIRTTNTNGILYLTPNGDGYVVADEVSIKSDGTSNIGIGNTFLKSTLTTAQNNYAFGNGALDALTTGLQNIGIGTNALSSVTVGDASVAVGHGALQNFTGTGSGETAIGNGALDALTTGPSNVAVGNNALSAITTTGLNVGIGVAAASTSTGIDNSIFIGFSADPAGNSQTNQIVIGSNATGNGSNTATWGNTSITDHYFTGTLNATDIASTGDLTLTPTSNVNISANSLEMSGTEFVDASRNVTAATLNADNNDGTWTPSITFGGGSTGITYSEQTGTYKVLDSIVYYSIRITLTNKGSSTGTVNISLPSLSPVGTFITFPASIVFGNLTFSTQVTVQAVTTTNVIGVYDGATLMTDTNFANNTTLRISGFYFLD